MKTTEQTEGVMVKLNLPTKELAEAVTALCQLVEHRTQCVCDWMPDWSNIEQIKHCIIFYENRIMKEHFHSTNTLLSFPEEEMRDEFLTNFWELIRKARPLMS